MNSSFNNRRPFISIVSPVYKAEGIIALLVKEIKMELQTFIDQDFEIILVEDGSPDLSWEEIVKESEQDKRVKGIKLSRNFGQHYAITAGLDQAKGEWIVVMDCDLQDQPAEIKKLYSKAIEGFDIVLGRRMFRADGMQKKFFSKLFYKCLSYLTGTLQDPAIANFGIYSRKSIEAVKRLREPIRYFPTMIRWVGFVRTTIDINHANRSSGKSSYDFRKLLSLALDIILANSDKPIRLIVKFGFFVALFSFVFGLYIIIQYYAGNIVVAGYTSLLVSIWFLGGLILMVLGVIGLYLGKTFEGVKNRPIYIIDQKMNVD